MWEAIASGRSSCISESPLEGSLAGLPLNPRESHGRHMVNYKCNKQMKAVSLNSGDLTVASASLGDSEKGLEFPPLELLSFSDMAHSQ